MQGLHLFASFRPSWWLFLAIAVLMHLCLFMTFRGQVVWPASPIEAPDFIGFKMPPLPPDPSPRGISPPELSAGLGAHSSDSVPQCFFIPYSNGEAPFFVNDGTFSGPSKPDKEPSYFRVPAFAEEMSFLLRYDHAPIQLTGSRSGFSLPIRPSGGPYLFHVRLGNLRKTQPH